MTTVRRRLVIYFSGFDPRGPRFYHRLYQDEAAQQSKVTGQAIEVGKRRRVDKHLMGWPIDSGETHTDYRIFEWDDIIRSHWPASGWPMILATLETGWKTLTRGIYRNSFHWSRGIFVTGLLGPLVLLLALLVGPGLLVVALLKQSWGWALAAGIAALATWLLRRFAEKHFNVDWVMRALRFKSIQADDGAPELSPRIDELVASLPGMVREGQYDELLLVGHSYGSVHSIAAAARLLDHWPPKGVTPAPTLSLLTLGPTTPSLAWQPRADRMRKEIARVATSDALAWVDVSAPADGAAYVMLDPYTAIGDRDPNRANPKLLNARLHETMDPALYEGLKRDFMRTHFQYLMATIRPAAFDYFALTAGPLTLADRFADRESARNFTSFRSRKMKAIR